MKTKIDMQKNPPKLGTFLKEKKHPSYDSRCFIIDGCNTIRTFRYIYQIVSSLPIEVDYRPLPLSKMFLFYLKKKVNE